MTSGGEGRAAGARAEIRFELWFEGGERSLELRSLTAEEGISTPFKLSIVARSKVAALDLGSIVGHGASLTVSQGDRVVRVWQGICNHLEQTRAMPGDELGVLSTYELEIVPLLWLLRHRSGHRIYQHLTTPDIVDKLLSEWGLAPTWEIDRASYRKLEYRVQSGETDEAFLNRLLEEAGIAFTFPDHGGTATTLTMGDNLSGGKARPNPLRFREHANAMNEQELVTELRLSREVRPGRVSLRDYDFRNPAFAPLGRAESDPTSPEHALERYAYDAGAFLAEASGGGTPVADQKGVYRAEEPRGTALAKRTLHALRTGDRAVGFHTNVFDLPPGSIFSVVEHHHPDLQSGKLLVTELHTSGSVGGDWVVRGKAVFADPASPYRPPQKTPKSIAHGLESAIVVGPPGKEIHVDELGRVRVQFPWDREGKNDDDSSCWLRVSQGWAGAGFGMLLHPRVGEEVWVAFQGGDPDMPVVVGRAFNGREVVPYKLPEHQTVSTWRSSSSPRTGGYNEIKFEDQAGQELVYTQAERDRNQLVKRDDEERVQRDKRATVGRDLDLTVQGERKELVHKNDHLRVRADQLHKVDGSISLMVGGSRDERVGADHAMDVSGDVHLKAGQTLVLEAGARLTIKGPGGFIDIHAGGIDIVGTMIKINSGGSAAEGQGASPTAPKAPQEARPKDTPSA